MDGLAITIGLFFSDGSYEEQTVNVFPEFSEKSACESALDTVNVFGKGLWAQKKVIVFIKPITYKQSAEINAKEFLKQLKATLIQ
jgi:hypothetical protein